MLTCSADLPPDLTCPWIQNTHSDPTTEGKYICCHVFWEGKPMDFQSLLFFALYMYGDVHDTPGIVSGQKALFGSPLSEAAR